VGCEQSGGFAGGSSFYFPAMASMRLSGAASSATASVTSLRVPGGVGANWVPQSLFASGGSSASATLTQR
jgi:hypothetical protein